MWNPNRIILSKTAKDVSRCSIAFYSRRSDPKSANSYKPIKTRKTVDDISNTFNGTNSNWELLAPRGYRFYMPGSVGPAWHDAYTTAHLEEFQSLVSRKITDKTLEYSVECIAQDCPILLRRGVTELFQGTEFGGAELTIVTLSQKGSPDISCAPRDMENEMEKITKFFVVAAQEICMKLRIAGYWADFINPFSGRPYLSPYYATAQYEPENKSSFLDFEIKVYGNCKFISAGDYEAISGSQKFVGSLFTTAPASTSLLRDILDQYD